jgi:DNA repair photolyase
MEESIEEKNTYGTMEWSVKTINFITGCKNDCKYCYGKSMGIRYKRNTVEDWSTEMVRQHDLTKKIPKFNGTVMFPSSHDITPEYLTESITVLGNILKSGNSVLIVSKPHLECIKKICETFTGYKDKILFRFTIGSTNSTILKYWEINSTSFEERLECLKLSYNQGYRTSVSSEPLLDRNVDALINKLSPYVTDTIWIGKPNLLLTRTKNNGYGDPETVQKCNELMEWITNPDFLLTLYDKYKDNSMIRWKDGLWKDISRLLTK